MNALAAMVLLAMGIAIGVLVGRAAAAPAQVDAAPPPKPHPGEPPAAPELRLSEGNPEPHVVVVPRRAPAPEEPADMFALEAPDFRGGDAAAGFSSEVTEESELVPPDFMAGMNSLPPVETRDPAT